MAIFPEGLVPTEEVVLAPFKKGAFSLAIEFNIPIVPQVYFDCKRLFSWNFLKGGPGVFRIHQHLFIETKGLKMDALNSLKQQTFDIIYNDLSTDVKYMNDTNRKKDALLRVAIEKEQIQKQFKELKRKFQEKKDSFHQHHQRKDTKWTQILKNKEMKDNTTTKINFPTLTIDTTDTTKEVLIQLYEKWYDLFAYSRAVSLKSTRSPFETKINVWRSTYC